MVAARLPATIRCQTQIRSKRGHVRAYFPAILRFHFLRKARRFAKQQLDKKYRTKLVLSLTRNENYLLEVSVNMERKELRRQKM